MSSWKQLSCSLPERDRADPDGIAMVAAVLGAYGAFVLLFAVGVRPNIAFFRLLPVRFVGSGRTMWMGVPIPIRVTSACAGEPVKARRILLGILFGPLGCEIR